jgi:tetratricopeptide (TPR) repeat protein
MDVEVAIARIEQILHTALQTHLNDLQVSIVHGIWKEQKYSEIADHLGYTEGHIKDMSAELWQHLSQGLGEKVTKSNLKAVLARHPAQSELGFERPEEFPQIRDRRNFVGREAAFTQLQTLWTAGERLVVIQAQGGIGKTTLARRFLQHQFKTVLEFAIAQEIQSITSVTSLVEERLYQLGEQPGREFGVSLDRLKRRLQSEPIGILVDNLEPTLDADGRLIAPHRLYLELFQVLADPTVQSFTLVTSRDRLCEPRLSACHYGLPGLTHRAWSDYCQQQQIRIYPEALTHLHTTYGGNAKAMEIVVSNIQLDFAGDMAEYWQQYQTDPLAHHDLANLVKSQFERLRQLDPYAYHLLCRLGGYRYQDVPTIPRAGILALLWDSPTATQQRVIESLRNRSLLEHHRGAYHLHPMIRADAIARLRLSSDQEPTHRAAAAFWTTQIRTVETIADALQGLEAYHHFVEIQDYEQAADVLLKRRPTKLSGVERLGRTFYKLGLLQPMQDAIQGILGQIRSGYHLSALYSIQGVLYRLSGQLHAAISSHQTSRNMAEQALRQYSISWDSQPPPEYLQLRNWELHALLNIGICYVELGELLDAQQVFTSLHTTHRQRLLVDHLDDLYNPSVEVFAAFVYSCLGNTESAQACADQFEVLMQQSPLAATGHRLLLLGLTYKKLGQLGAAETLLNRASAYGVEHHYPQVQANALSGLAELRRIHGDFAQALELHQSAIAILEKLGTQFDLAEGLYQMGLTHCDRGDSRQGQSCFKHAIQLFQAMSAPAQVAKITKKLRI